MKMTRFEKEVHAETKMSESEGDQWSTDIMYMPLLD
jgi:hypothetical protein